MEQRRFLNPSQPQTLQIAVLLLYINAALALLFGAVTFPPLLLLVVAEVVGAYGTANERKWGYVVAVVAAVVPLIWVAYVFVHYGLGTVLSLGVISLIFEIALVALLLHPQSREYQRIWFK